MTVQRFPDGGAQDAALNAFNKGLMKTLQQAQLDAQIARAQAAAARSEAAERVEALRAVNAALLGSLRPFGLDRRKFSALIRDSARAIPNAGPEAARHAFLLAETERVLGALGAGRGPGL
ncbi:hypothetical protein Q8W71_10625 [Methylobacterium sp. NEAU 140]|uniref:hypothetical protein n=1 Tax=Methylobacterium sp. NEAU 140 TaxID=3064945 RepID=UPI002737463A|nr:hypothetical protein [Methylobacterium sp. NEAU 140]MDP4023078.1 hypothetical protein [Methylobacterium sp. NEAU 140]